MQTNVNIFRIKTIFSHSLRPKLLVFVTTYKIVRTEIWQQGIAGLDCGSCMK